MALTSPDEEQHGPHRPALCRLLRDPGEGETESGARTVEGHLHLSRLHLHGGAV